MSNFKNHILPDPDTLNQVPYGKFVLANLAAKRAKQLKEGAAPLVRIDSNHPLTVALAEISAGKIKPIFGAETAEAVEAVDVPTLDVIDDGFLLPGLEDVDEELLKLDEVEEEVEEEDDSLSLSDLVDESDEEPVVETDGNELSLDDLAEQEEAGADDADPIEE